jgi:hypothetical protein
VAGSIVIYGAYIGYVAAAITIFALRSPQQAVLVSSFLGWLLLPVAIYPADVTLPGHFTMDIIGTALPSRLLLTKAIIVAVTVFVCLALKAPGVFARFRVTVLDLALGLFCLSPLLASLAGKVSVEQGLGQAAYLTGVWGCTWMTARLALGDRDGRRGLATAIVLSGLVLLVPAIVEAVRPAWIYAAVYGPHPFVFDGVGRYFGFRPMAFFEHGNQYGIWISMAALAGMHRVLVGQRRSAGDIVIAALLVACAVASQSVGALLLFVVGSLWMLIPPQARRGMLVAAALLAALGGTAYLSGKVPLRSWALETPTGQAVNAVLRASGRGSLGWRVQRDQKALGLIHGAPLTGYGTWDWWRPAGAHPWGLPLLIAGQFGLLSLLSVTIALLGAALRDIWRGSNSVLPILIVCATIDAWLNSAIYLPAILAAAAIAVPMRRSSADPGRVRAAGDAAAPSNEPEKSYGV